MVVVIQRRELSKKEGIMVKKHLMSPFQTVAKYKGMSFFITDENEIKIWLLNKFGKGYYYVFVFGGRQRQRTIFSGEV